MAGSPFYLSNSVAKGINCNYEIKYVSSLFPIANPMSTPSSVTILGNPIFRLSLKLEKNRIEHCINLVGIDRTGVIQFESVTYLLLITGQ
ncbi:hypothetical protein J2X69_000197 [Algoriphagus sp. 4150]|nr:hypothetical protein [Algoriphagus sp. 4150]